MERIPTELVYILIFLGIIIFNYVMQQAARRRQQEEAEQAAQAEPPPAEDEPLEDIWGRSRAPVPEPAPVFVPRPAQPAPRAAPPVTTQRRRHPIRELLKSKRDLRRAAVLVTVLGPCRAQEPPPR